MLSSQAEALARALAIFVGLPLIGWLSLLVAERAKAESLKRNGHRTDDQHRLFWTVRLIFVAGAVWLALLALRSLYSEPADYLAICGMVAAALLIYPAWSNFSRLGFAWGALGTLAQFASVALVATAVWFGLPELSRSALPTVEVLRSYMSLVTWPVVAIIGGIVFFPHVSRALESIDSLEGFGGKISLRRRQEIEEDVEASLQDDVEPELTASSAGANIAVDEIAALSRRVRRADTRYGNVIKSWGILSRLIANIATAAGEPSINVSNNGLHEMEAKGVLPPQLAGEAIALFKERNGFKRREAPITATEHRRYLDRAQELANKLSALLPNAGSSSMTGVGDATRH